MRLDKGGIITGRVLASDSGRPLAGAKVVVAIDAPLPADLPEDATRNVARSDAQGRFRLEGIGSSPFTLSARAPGHAIGERRDVKAGAVVDVVLFPGSTLRGMVRDDDGRPVSGALVRAEADRFWGKEPPPERTDPEGRFEMAGVTPGEYEVVARLGGRAPAFGRVVVEPEAEATVSLLLSAGGFVRGRVVDELGRPLRGRVWVDVVDDHGLSASMGDLMTTESKDDGTFALGPVPIGGLGLAASAPRRATRRFHALVAAPRRTVDLGDVALEAGLQIRGHVRAREGRVLPGATLTARSEASGGGRSVEGNADAKGAFALDGLEAGWYRVTIAAPEYARTQVRVAAGGEPLDIVLEAAGVISGRVVDAQGRPVHDGSVNAKARDAKLDARPQESEADPADGSFKIEGLAGGAYDLEARASGHAPALLANVSVVAGRTTAVGTLTLSRGGVVSGSIVDAEGHGVPGASVYVETDPSRLTEDLASQTDSAGAFEIRGVPAGRVRVRALHPSFTPGGVPEHNVEPAKDPVPIRIVLGPGARVEGHVRYRDGRPFAAGRVIVSSSDPSAAYGWPEPIPLDDSGAFVAEHVLPGRARVHVLAFTPRVTPISSGVLTTLSQIAVQPVEPREGETVMADVTLRDVVVSGRITRGGRAASGVRISVSSGGPSISFSGLGGAPPPTAAAGPPALVATTGEDGGYELQVFVPGPARVGLAAVASGQGFPARQVTVPDTNRFGLDLEIGEAAVSGVVVDRDSGAPLPDVSLRLSRIDGHGYTGAPGRSGPDGRFEIGAEAGEYTLAAELPGRVRVVLPVRVDPAGLADLRLEMDKGLAIVGRLQDATGRPAAGQMIVAIGADGFERAAVRADGSFRLEGLTDRPYALSVGSTLAGFATRREVRPGPEPVALTLRPPGRVTLRVVSPDGRPVAEALASVVMVDSAPVDLRGSTAPPTNEEGATEIGVPAGEVGIAVRGESGGGFGTVAVRAGETATLVIVLQPRPGASPLP
jgi:hypothetical protein